MMIHNGTHDCIAIKFRFRLRSSLHIVPSNTVTCPGFPIKRGRKIPEWSEAILPCASSNG
jgi:hypothetical protein